MRYKVPEERLKRIWSRVPCNSEIADLVCEAFAADLAENPIVPTEQQIADMAYSAGGSMGAKEWCVEWQRRMFAAPEEEPDKAVEAVSSKLRVWGISPQAAAEIVETVRQIDNPQPPADLDAPIRRPLWKERGEYPEISNDANITSSLHNKAIREALRIGLAQGRKEGK